MTISGLATKSLNYRAFPNSVKILVSTIGAFPRRIGGQSHRKFRLAAVAGHAGINSLVSELGQCEKRRKDRKSVVAMEVALHVFGKNDQRARAVTKPFGNRDSEGLFGAGLVRSRFAFLTDEAKEISTKVEKFLEHVTEFDEFLTISSEYCRWTKQGATWARA